MWLVWLHILPKIKVHLKRFFGDTNFEKHHNSKQHFKKETDHNEITRNYEIQITIIN